MKIEISDHNIEEAKAITNYTETIYHEHPDCIRIAYQWLDAQQITLRRVRYAFPLKHIIESWAERYVSQADVEVAATMHPFIKGEYPYYFISSNLTEPDASRLKDISEALTQDNYRSSGSEVYKRSEG